MWQTLYFTHILKEKYVYCRFFLASLLVCKNVFLYRLLGRNGHVSVLYTVTST